MLLKAKIEFFFNGVGYLVKFEVVGPQGALRGGKGAPLALENLGTLTKKGTLKMTRKEIDRRGVIPNLIELGK